MALYKNKYGIMCRSLMETHAGISYLVRFLGKLLGEGGLKWKKSFNYIVVFPNHKSSHICNDSVIWYFIN